MPKSSKKFILSNSNINAYGFRMLTEGADLDDFRKNPIMLWNHIRAFGESKEQVLPLGYWDDIQIEGDNITAVPFFDDNDAFAMSIYHKVENETIRMASIGAIPITVSDDPDDMLPGQMLPTFVKWKAKEASTTDIGANNGCLAVALYDENDNLIKLSDLSTHIPALFTNQISSMKITPLTAPKLAALLKLNAETATAEQLLDAVEGVVESNKQLTQQKTELETEKQKSDNKVTELTTKLSEKEIEVLLADGVKDRKITVEEGKQLVELTDGKIDKIKKYLEAKPASPMVNLNLNGNTATTNDASELEKLSKLSWSEMDKQGLLPKLKTLSLDTFKAKYAEAFPGSTYKEK